MALRAVNEQRARRVHERARQLGWPSRSRVLGWHVSSSRRHPRLDDRRRNRGVRRHPCVVLARHAVALASQRKIPSDREVSHCSSPFHRRDRPIPRAPEIGVSRLTLIRSHRRPSLRKCPPRPRSDPWSRSGHGTVPKRAALGPTGGTTIGVTAALTRTDRYRRSRRGTRTPGLNIR